jgi:hypothetical protein
MKERGILFKPEMVLAILDGRKSMTRRLSGLDKINENPDLWKVTGPYETKNSWYFTFTKVDTAIRNEIIRCPYGVPGDRLWVKETFWECIDNNDRIYYAATETPETTDRRHYKKRPSLFMERMRSRIDLELTNIRVERLQDITEEDAVKEGFTSRSEFAEYIKMINGPDVWDKNHWVWVIEFRRVK